MLGYITRDQVIANGMRTRLYGPSGSSLAARDYLRHVLPFRTAGSFSAIAVEGNPPTDTGNAPTAVRSDYARHAPYMVYVVMSYRTPIAWLLRDGTVHVPDVTYSPTTSRHQSVTRAWLNHARG